MVSLHPQGMQWASCGRRNLRWVAAEGTVPANNSVWSCPVEAQSKACDAEPKNGHHCIHNCILGM